MIDRITEQPFCQTRVMCRAVDNLELLLSQPDESVDLIYCDILYGTGKNFGDYKDLKAIKEIIEEHYIPRIKEMRRVLKPSGSIYLQMDTKINHWMRILMDDIFGYDNFRNEIIWFYRRWTAPSKSFQKYHDVVLYYTKSKDYTFNPIYEQSANEKKGRKESYKLDENGKLFRWQTANGERYKIYRNENGVICGDVWDIPFLHPSSKERVNYATQKPKELIQRIILASSNEGDIIADYYLGSGTTAIVCKELNRSFIGCDINPKAIEITNARLDAVS